MTGDKITVSDLRKRALMKNSDEFDVLEIINQMTVRCMSKTSAAIKHIQREVSLEPKLFEELREAETSCRSMAGKISGIAEIFGRGSRLNMCTYDIKQFFGVLAEQINFGVGDITGGKVSFSMQKNTFGSAVFDARRVCTIIYQLVTNAIQHGGTDNKDIAIKCRLRDGCLEVSVQDHGTGISESAAAVLNGEAEMPFNLEKQNIGEFPPYLNGIGYKICKKLVNEMGGKIWFKNYITGARFTFKIPQNIRNISEVSVYIPDGKLFKICVAPVLTMYGKSGVDAEPQDGKGDDKYDDNI